MGIVEDVENKAKGVAASFIFQRCAVVAGQVAAAVLVAHQPQLAKVVGAIGVTLSLDPNQVQMAVTGLAAAALHGLGHYLADKFPSVLGWLGSSPAEAAQG